MNNSTTNPFARTKLLVLPWAVLIACVSTLGWLSSMAGIFALFPYGCIVLYGLLAFYYAVNRSRISAAIGGKLSIPFLVVLALLVTAGFAYYPSQLDSLSYRLPRVYLWLQNNYIGFIPCADQRINYMPALWELNALPFFFLLGDKGFWIINLFAWLSLWVLLVDLSELASLDEKLQRSLSYCFLFSSVAVLQVTSTMNDLFAGVFLLLSACWLLAFYWSKAPWTIVASGLALSICAGTKPHYAVFALPWLLWFFCGKAKPWRLFPWKYALPIAVLVLMSSPLITFVANYHYYGSVKGELSDTMLQHGGIFGNIVFGFCSFWWQAFQPPLQPLASLWNDLSTRFLQEWGVSAIAPRFSLQSREVQIVDVASLGFFSAVAMVFGWVIGVKKAMQGGDKKSLYLWLVACTGFVIATANLVPGTLGRSFVGFALLGVPLAVFGLAAYPRVTRIFALCSFASAVIVITLSPAHPLWPVKTIYNSIESNEAVPKKVKEAFAKYLSFSHKYFAGRSLLTKLPDEKASIAAVVFSDQSLVQLWYPKRKNRTIHFVSLTDSFQDILKTQPDYILVIGHPVRDEFAEFLQELHQSSHLTVFAEDQFISKGERALEPWTLYQVK